ncbi:hypothetical protein CF327_g5395 [Tilletia walkeri]|uniref:GH16 domain-containing protein n=1 Tax=Tilletia walkeri TaxID=117179 RepID=A0A8X7NDC4_9BASI|nr:hypothetical protein CF327_g5395 [Tilletia walkeri]KAE8271876.1 hypothetical protein A4X09_0g431 [Tilletia walkeri]
MNHQLRADQPTTYIATTTGSGCQRPRPEAQTLRDCSDGPVDSRRPSPSHSSGKRSKRSVTTSILVSALATVSLGLLPTQVHARNWTLQQEISGNQFFDEFFWWPYGDPTQGTVSYQSESNAIKQNLSYVDEKTGRFVIRPDSNSFVDPSSEGRASVRMHSKKSMRDGLLVAKISKMPVGCGTWPAFWTVTTDQWPNGGEIDILEGVNAVSTSSKPNLASLHTTDGCTIGPGKSQNSTGFSYQENCSYQPGCSQQFSDDNTYGTDFNENGGGYFAMLRDTAPGGNGISVYFWPDDAKSVPIAVSAAPGSAPRRVITSPEDLAPGGNNNTLNKLPDKTYQWGLPAAFFANTAPGTTAKGASCQMDQFFDADHTIIINLTFCGQWAGAVWSSDPVCSRLAPTCDEYVRNNPHAFDNASFEFDYIRLYGSQNSQGAGSVILGKGLGSGRPGWMAIIGVSLATCFTAGLLLF